MKKLIIAAVIMLTAIVSQAAAVTWTVNNIQASPANSPAAGWLVQIYDASTVFSFEDAKAGNITALDSAASVASGTIFKASNKFGNYASGDAISTYAVVFDAGTLADASYYVISDSISKTVNAAGADVIMGFGNMASTATTNMFRNSTWSAAAVPEPTSGLLILLGMAGLALRRRRA